MDESKYINRLLVDIDAIKSNIIELKKKSAPAGFFAVIKADGYGLGAARILKSIDNMVDAYCVSSVEEGVELRGCDTDKEILNLGYTHTSDVEKAANNSISITLYDYDYAVKLNDLLAKLNLRVKAHIKLDTGHGRLGFRKSHKSLDEIEKIFHLSNIEIEGIFSHLATADEEDVSHTIEQKEIFEYMVDSLKDRGVEFKKIHLSNDAGFIKHGFKYDFVRSGICLYGSYPSDLLEKEREVNLLPTVQWLSKVSFVKRIQKGDSISYGRTFIAEKDMKVATISVGYADGYKRANSNKGFVLINGQKANILGRVTMDQTMVDVTNIEHVSIGDDVVLIGNSGEYSITPEMLAKWADTISYEILTSVSKRVPRLYHEN